MIIAAQIESAALRRRRFRRLGALRLAEQNLSVEPTLENARILAQGVVGLGVERRLLAAVVADAAGRALTARIVETPRNGPVRNLYRDGGFREAGGGVWVNGEIEASVAA